MRAAEQRVYLNVYDLHDGDIPVWQRALYDGLFSVGVGLHHSAVQAFNRELTFLGEEQFGDDDDSDDSDDDAHVNGGALANTSGVLENAPRRFTGASFRESVYIGTTTLTERQFDALVEQLKRSYSSRSYDLLRRNCNHFADELCVRLTGRHAPLWINRVSGLADSVRDWLPASLIPPAPTLNTIPPQPPPPPPSSSSSSPSPAHGGGTAPQEK